MMPKRYIMPARVGDMWIGRDFLEENQLPPDAAVCGAVFEVTDDGKLRIQIAGREEVHPIIVPPEVFGFRPIGPGNDMAPVGGGVL